MRSDNWPSPHCWPDSEARRAVLAPRQREWGGALGTQNSMAAAATAKSLQSCPPLWDPIDGSPPGSPVPGFSRQEHWSGLPFPSPMHESEK